MSRCVVSVCIVTFNQAGFIGQCLRSILDQRVDAEVEVLLGDDASTDSTVGVVSDLMASYPGRINYFRRSSNIGAFDNMCDLLNRARGDFVARVDGDDYWFPGKLQKQLDYLWARPDCPAVYTNASVVDVGGRIVGCFSDYDRTSVNLGQLMTNGNFLNNSSVLFRAGLVQGWVEPRQQIDYQVHLWMACRGCLGYIPDRLTAYRVGSAGSMLNDMNVLVRELYWSALLSVPKEYVSGVDWNRAVSDFMRRVFFRSLRTGDWKTFWVWRERVLLDSSAGWAGLFAAIARIGFKSLRGRLLPRNRRILYPY